MLALILSFFSFGAYSQCGSTNEYAFLITKQANIAVGFLEVSSPVKIADINSASGVNTEVSIGCRPGGSTPVIKWGDSEQQFVAFDEEGRWSFDASSLDVQWFTRVEMLDIMYDWQFDGDDELQGIFTVFTDSTFLKEKFEWSPGTTMGDMIETNIRLKATWGKCPVLGQGYNRLEDLVYGLGHRVLDLQNKRNDYMRQYVVENHGGKPNNQGDEDYGKLGRLLHEYMVDDQLNVQRNFSNEMSRNIAGMTCLTPTYVFDVVENGEGLHRFKYADLNASVHRSDDPQYHSLQPGRFGLGYLPDDWVDRPVMMPKKTEDAVKNMLYDMLPPQNGFPEPTIKARWFQKDIVANISHIPELTLGLYEEWISGSPTNMLSDLLAKQTYRTMANTWEQRDTANNKEMRDIQWSTWYGHNRISDIDDILNKHRGENQQLLDRRFMNWEWVSDTFMTRAVPWIMGLEDMTKYFLEHPEARAKYYENPEKAILEWLRLGAAQTMVSRITDNRRDADYGEDLEGSYWNLNTSWSANSDSGFGEMIGGNLHRFHIDTANRDPSVFSKPNTFDPDREDWGEALTFGAPLKYWYDAGGNLDPKGPVNKNATTRFHCPALYTVLKVSEIVVSFVLDAQADIYDERRSQCVDDDLEVERIFGAAIVPEYSVCYNAMARVDARFGMGTGCQIWGQECCATCATLDLESVDYVNMVRLMVMSTTWFPDQFKKTSIASYRLFIETQPYFDDESIVEVTPTGKKNYYKGPESIFEYYSLQNREFNPSSFRLPPSVWGLTKHVVPLTYEFDEDGKRFRTNNFNPAITAGRNARFFDPPYDFAQFRWDNTTAILPIRGAFHHFRQPTAQSEAAGFIRGMAGAFGEPYELCHLIMERCSEFNIFDDYDHCYNYMAKIPDQKVGYCPSLAGNTRACRWTHSLLTHEKLRPETHCYHLGPELADPDGKIKCTDTECGYYLQGPIECDEKSCDGTLMHSGEVVEIIHVIWWGIMLGMAVLLLFRERNQPKRNLQSQKLEALLVFLTLDWFIFGMTHLCAYLLMEDAAVVWRSPPPQAEMPRFFEQTGQEGDRIISHRYATFYNGLTENLFSHFNMYILQHFIYYLLLSSILFVCGLMEYLGVYYHGKHSDSALAHGLKHLGDAAFCACVTVAFIMPHYPFSVFIYCVGMTKLCYPQITFAIWDAYGIQEEKVVQSGLRRGAVTVRDKLSVFQGNTLHEHKMTLRAKTARGEIEEKISCWDYCIRISGCMGALGGLLHHSCMCVLFAATVVGVDSFNQSPTYIFALWMGVFFVLLQHIISQWVLSVPLQIVMIATVEVFFQWVVFAWLAQADTTIAATATFLLAVSHMLMTSEVITIAVLAMAGGTDDLLEGLGDGESDALSPTVAGMSIFLGNTPSTNFLSHTPRKGDKSSFNIMHNMESIEPLRSEMANKSGFNVRTSPAETVDLLPRRKGDRRDSASINDSFDESRQYNSVQMTARDHTSTAITFRGDTQSTAIFKSMDPGHKGAGTPAAVTPGSVMSGDADYTYTPQVSKI